MVHGLSSMSYENHFPQTYGPNNQIKHTKFQLPAQSTNTQNNFILTLMNAQNNKKLETPTLNRIGHDNVRHDTVTVGCNGDEDCFGKGCDATFNVQCATSDKEKEREREKWIAGWHV